MSSAKPLTLAFPLTLLLVCLLWVVWIVHGVQSAFSCIVVGDAHCYARHASGGSGAEVVCSRSDCLTLRDTPPPGCPWCGASMRRRSRGISQLVAAVVEPVIPVVVSFVVVCVGGAADASSKACLFLAQSALGSKLVERRIGMRSRPGCPWRRRAEGVRWVLMSERRRRGGSMAQGLALCQMVFRVVISWRMRHHRIRGAVRKRKRILTILNVSRSPPYFQVGNVRNGKCLSWTRFLSKEAPDA